ncbi:MAG: FecR domain-containing protein [Elusimicrobia bacterium]|nr:FecR domain-containing protein [Elusimicrobiota bacterium]
MNRLTAAVLIALAARAAAGAEDAGAPADPSAPLPFAGVTLVSATGRVEIRDPRSSDFQAAGELPAPLGAGMNVRTGAMSRAMLDLDDGAEIALSAHSSVRVSNPMCELREGRLRARAGELMRIAVRTAASPARIRGKAFSVEMAGKGKGRTAALGNGRAVAAQLIAVKGFVEVQLPFGTVRATDTPVTLHEGSVVQTAANSYALIVFPDGSRVKLRADSTAAVENERRCVVAAGAADVQVTPKGRLEIRTIDREAQVRGAAFSIDLASPTGEPGSDEPDPSLTTAGRDLPGAEGWDR